MSKTPIFNTVELRRPKGNNIDLTHDVKMTGMMGNLMPTMVKECVPGDKWKLSCDILVRMAPMIAPIMHRLDVTQHYFFVPYRLLWENWEDFITNTGTPSFPKFTINDSTPADSQKLLDYLEVPPVQTGQLAKAINAMPLAAYQMVYNEYYRDENLVAEVDYALTDGDNSANTDLIQLRKRAWEHDYFTSALPFAQKGDAVDVPIGNIILDPDWSTGGLTSIPNFTDTTGAQPTGTGDQSAGQIDWGTVALNKTAYDPDGTLITDPITINELRRAFRLQEWLERNALGGTRYIEHILAHFGVRSSDKRLQRPEYITGTKSPIVISEVLNSTGISGELPQGNMAGHGVSVGDGYSGSYFCEEHGLIIGIMSIMPKPTYMQGLPKLYTKFDPFDYFWNSFEHIGEQEIKNSEIYAYEATDDGTFGYLPRYAEYKNFPSRVAGDFRTSLDFWHLGRIFSSLPTLSEDFIQCDTDSQDLDRIFAVNDGTDLFYIHILHRIKTRRLMAVYGTPYM